MIGERNHFPKVDIPENRILLAPKHCQYHVFNGKVAHHYKKIYNTNSTDCFIPSYHTSNDKVIFFVENLITKLM